MYKLLFQFIQHVFTTSEHRSFGGTELNRRRLLPWPLDFVQKVLEEMYCIMQYLTCFETPMKTLCSCSKVNSE